MGTLSPIGFYELFFLISCFVLVIGAAFFALILILRRRQCTVVKFEAIHIRELIELIISVGSFVFVCTTMVFLVLQNRIIVTQTKYASQSVESNIFSNVTGQNLGTDEIFLRYPEIRPYFYLGKDLTESDPLANRVKAAAEYLLDYYDSQSSQLKKYPGMWRVEQGSWEANISDMFAWSPVLCRYLEANKHWYGDDLVALKQMGEKKRERGQRKQLLPQR